MPLIGPIRGPLTLAVALGEGVLEMALTVVREVRVALEDEPAPAPVPRDAAGAPADAPVAVSSPTSRVRRSRPPASPRRRPSPPAADSPSAADSPAPPPAPPVSEKVKTIDDAPVPVAEFGEQGAEEDAGAQVTVAEPWDGYDSMTAPQVRDRLQGADRETLATVVLYEGFGKTRSSVIEAAERRLTRLSAAGS